MKALDYCVIAAFVGLIVFIGLSFSKTAGRDMRSFFSAGGAVPWWINGLSLFMGFVSAGTFVVWGSIAYSSGFVAISIQWTMGIAGFAVGAFVAPRWHKTRVMTAAEYISGRLGARVQKSYSYIYLFIMLFMTGVYLYSVARILNVSTGLSLHGWIAALGVMVILYTALGGLWAVVVTDTLQFVILSAMALIVAPLAVSKVGGLASFLSAAPTEGFFCLSNHQYTWSFLITFGIYNFFYLAGQWSFVQRYTSVASPREARKVGWLFAALYAVCPVIWMLPPMAFRVLNPELSGLEDEGAYLLMSKAVLPAGMLGLLLISLVFATNSSVQGVLNISAGVIANDLFRARFPEAPESRLLAVAKVSTVVFGLLTVAIAMLVPWMGGAREVVFSMAGLTGGPLYLPLVVALFSRKLTGRLVLATTLLSLAVTLGFKFVVPAMGGAVLSRAQEMFLGIAVPAAITLGLELWLRMRRASEREYLAFEALRGRKIAIEQAQGTMLDKQAADENRKGLRMVAIGIVFTGVMIGAIGLGAAQGRVLISGVGVSLVLLGIAIQRPWTNRSLQRGAK